MIDFMKFNLGTVAYRHPMSQKPANKQDYRMINLIIIVAPLPLMNPPR
jgi:hypothetical protein